jgi:hypothetical protein
LTYLCNESTFIPDSKHLHNVVDTLQPVQQCVLNLRIFYNWFYSQSVLILLIDLSTAVGLTPGGSTHLHAIHRTSQLTTQHHE